MSDAAPGEGPARAIGDLERGGQGFFTGEVQANGQAQVVARPPREGEAHDGPHQSDAPQRTLCLAGCPGPIAGVCRACARPAGLLHDGLIAADLNDGIRRHEGGSTADDVCPEWRTVLGEGSASQEIRPRKCLTCAAPLPHREVVMVCRPEARAQPEAREGKLCQEGPLSTPCHNVILKGPHDEVKKVSTVVSSRKSSGKELL